VQHEVCFVAVETFLRSFDSGVLHFWKLVKLDEERAEQLFFVRLTVWTLRGDLVPKLYVKWAGKGLLNLVLVRQINWQEDRLRYFKAEHVDSLHEARLHRLALLSVAILVKRNKLCLVALAQEPELEVQDRRQTPLIHL